MNPGASKNMMTLAAGAKLPGGTGPGTHDPTPGPPIPAGEIR